MIGILWISTKWQTSFCNFLKYKKSTFLRIYRIKKNQNVTRHPSRNSKKNIKFSSNFFFFSIHIRQSLPTPDIKHYYNCYLNIFRIVEFSLTFNFFKYFFIYTLKTNRKGISFFFWYRIIVMNCAVITHLRARVIAMVLNF